MRYRDGILGGAALLALYHLVRPRTDAAELITSLGKGMAGVIDSAIPKPPPEPKWYDHIEGLTEEDKTWLDSVSN